MNRARFALFAAALTTTAVTPQAAAAGDGPSLYARQLVGTGGWPTGAISDTRVQLRMPGHRSDSVLFQNTYTGVGGRLQLSPAFIDVGPRLSFAPIDIFDVEVQGNYTGYAGPFAPLPMDGIDGRIGSARKLRDGEQIGMHKWEATVSPTLKLKLGPVVAFDSMSISRIHASTRAETDSPYFYEPYRDLVVAWDDTTIEHQGAVVYELMDGDDKAKLWVGGTARHRAALGSKDTNTTAGALVVWKPGTAKATPTLIGQAHFFVKDHERVGTMPNLQVAAKWEFDKKIGKAEELGDAVE